MQDTIAAVQRMESGLDVLFMTAGGEIQDMITAAGPMNSAPDVAVLRTGRERKIQ